MAKQMPMTPAEITAHVMALSPEQVDRACGVDVMGWTIQQHAPVYYYSGYAVFMRVENFRPSTDRNQSRQVTDKFRDITVDDDALKTAMVLVRNVHEGDDGFTWLTITPLDESRAALIAHYTHRGGIE